jgi:hypothetical protein
MEKSNTNLRLIFNSLLSYSLWYNLKHAMPVLLHAIPSIHLHTFVHVHHIIIDSD